MLLSDRDIRAAIKSGRVVIDPYDPDMVQPSSIDVRLDRYFRVFENHRYPHIDPAIEQADLTRLVQTEGEEPFVLHPGEFVLAATYERITLPDDIAGRLEGKALAVDTPIPTLDGWRRMGDLLLGDFVFDEHGRPTEVVAATKVMTGRECREVVFSDHQSIVADLDHQWLTTTRHERERGFPAQVRTTRELERSLRADDEWNHQVPVAGPAQYPTRAVPAEPYLLGIWLGLRTGADAEPLSCAPDGAPPFLKKKRIPKIYLRSSFDQRLGLLQGLMDAAGRVDELGRCEFASTREYMADAVQALTASLGLRPVKRKMPITFREIDYGVAYGVRFAPNIPVFRKRQGRHRPKKDLFYPYRSIVDVRPVASRPVRCIQVAAPSGVFLAGRTYIPTHNSSLGRLGLLTHSTAGWIDPGFTGHVTLELSNVATLPIKLWPGMKIGQLCLFRCSSPAEHPYGSAVYGSRYQGQRGPTPSRSYRNFHRTDV